jgi:hypothetical protein
MKIDFEPSAAINFLRGIVSELREKRLWPVAVALLVAIVAVPVLLSKSASGTPVAQVPRPLSPPSASTSLPALSVQSTPSQSRLTGSARDPFSQQRNSASSTASSATASTARSTAASAASPASSAPRTASPGTGVAATSGTAAPTTTAPTTTAPTTTAPTTTAPTTITPGATPKPAPTGLTTTQSYHVTLAITNPAGGLDTIDPLERLTVLPSDQQPLLVELGVLKGGNRVLFAVQPGTVVTGPGTCTPGPIDCEILSLAQDQTESLSMGSPSGVVPVALFAVTAITADKHPSAAMAGKVRRMASAAGRDLLSKSTLSALSLFQYEPSLGVVVDLRNLTVGGS